MNIQTPTPLRREEFAKGMTVSLRQLIRVHDTLVYLDMFGPRTKVRATWAALKGGGRRHWFKSEPLRLKKGEHLVIKRPLPCGWDNWIMLHKQAAYDHLNPNQPFYLIDLAQRDGVPANFYPFLTKAIPIPILPAWTEWLWHAAEASGAVISLPQSYNSHGSLRGHTTIVKTDPQRWERLIKQGFSRNHLRF